MRFAHAAGRADEVPWEPEERMGLWGRLCAAITGRNDAGEDAEPGEIWEIES